MEDILDKIIQKATLWQKYPILMPSLLIVNNKNYNLIKELVEVKEKDVNAFNFYHLSELIIGIDDSLKDDEIELH